jgi:hypothetical protein
MTSKDQDFNQRFNMATTVSLEFYRVLMGSFLVLFVPQLCDDHVCSMNENVNRGDTLTNVGIALNSITLLSFFLLYFIEIKRENKMITYLEVNKFKPLDNESVGKALCQLEPSKKDNILLYDTYYQNIGFLCTGIFTVNSTVSSIVIYTNYLDSKTFTVFLTNFLFMSLKVLDVYNTVNTKPNIFFSAYLKKKVQYNDVDPDKYIEPPTINIPIEEHPVEKTDSV